MKNKPKDTKPVLTGIDAELAAMLPTMKLDGWETRRSSRGTVKLYIRCSPVEPTTKLALEH